MKKFVENNIKGSFVFTNNQVDNIRNDESFNKNHLAKMLYSNIETYKIIINSLIEKQDELRNR